MVIIIFILFFFSVFKSCFVVYSGVFNKLVQPNGFRRLRFCLFSPVSFVRTIPGSLDKLLSYTAYSICSQVMDDEVEEDVVCVLLCALVIYVRKKSVVPYF